MPVAKSLLFPSRDCLSWRGSPLSRACSFLRWCTFNHWSSPDKFNSNWKDSEAPFWFHISLWVWQCGHCTYIAVRLLPLPKLLLPSLFHMYSFHRKAFLSTYLVPQTSPQLRLLSGELNWKQFYQPWSKKVDTTYFNPGITGLKIDKVTWNAATFQCRSEQKRTLNHIETVVIAILSLRPHDLIGPLVLEASVI